VEVTGSGKPAQQREKKGMQVQQWMRMKIDYCVSKHSIQTRSTIQKKKERKKKRVRLFF